MELLDLPEECILHILEYLPVKGVIACGETCQRLRALMPSNVLWLPRLREEFGVELKVTLAKGPPVEARKVYRAAKQCKPENAIRFWGCYTDGGCDLNRRQYWMDHLFAPNSLESYCSATTNNVHCIGVLANSEGATARDEGKARYREYLLRRLRVPAGVVFGHGLVDLAVIQGSEEVDSAVMQRLQSNSLAELEHLFLEFYQELMVGNTLGRLLLHGLVGNERESERAHMTTVAAGIERHITETNEELKVSPEDANRLFDDSVLPHLGCSEGSLPPVSVGVLEKLTVSRAGHFSCPVLAGVIFVANCNPYMCRSTEDVKRSLMEAANREECRAFDDLKDEKAVAEAVKSGKLPSRTMHAACKAGTYLTFSPGKSLAGGAANAGSHAVGPLQPVAWFKFHTRTEAHKWAAEPVTVWEGQDPDLAHPTTTSAAAEAPPAESLPDEAGPSGAGAEPSSAEEAEAMAAEAEASLAEYASNSGIAGIVGDIGQMAQAWLGGHNSSTLSESLDSDYDPVGVDSEDSLLMDMDADSGGDEDDISVEQDDEEGLVPEQDDDDDTDIDMDGEPRGTKGRNLLEINLPRRVAGNVVLVKLIDQEDLMHEWDDQHDDPNIDINHIIFSGRTLQLPSGAVLST